MLIEKPSTIRWCMASIKRASVFDRLLESCIGYVAQVDFAPPRRHLIRLLDPHTPGIALACPPATQTVVLRQQRRDACAQHLSRECGADLEQARGVPHVDPQAQPIMHIALSSKTQGMTELSRYAEDKLVDRLRAIDGVAVVEVMGALHRELSVLLKAQKLREYHISVGDVVVALRAQNITAPVGQVHGLLEDVNFRLVGRITAPAEFAQIPVKRRGADLIRLGQVRRHCRWLCRGVRHERTRRRAQRRPLHHSLARIQHRHRGR
jgi:hypothetical protein